MEVRRTGSTPFRSHVARALENAVSSSSTNQIHPTPFDSSQVPEIAIEKYVQRLGEWFQCSDCCHVVALLYIDRAVNLNPSYMSLSMQNVHRFYLTALLLAVKFWDDRFWTNTYYAKSGGVQLKELNKLEKRLLVLLDYTLGVTPDTYNMYFCAVTRVEADPVDDADMDMEVEVEIIVETDLSSDSEPTVLVECGVSSDSDDDMEGEVCVALGDEVTDIVEIDFMELDEKARAGLQRVTFDDGSTCVGDDWSDYWSEDDEEFTGGSKRSRPRQPGASRDSRLRRLKGRPLKVARNFEEKPRPPPPQLRSRASRAVRQFQRQMTK